tara:strand:- start:327 stop:518 length:192 start_codon:yes stop_codon:yes gene_type:complete
MRIIEKADKIVKLTQDQVIQALANYLDDNDMLKEHEAEGKMMYKMNDDASITIELHFTSPTNH